MHPSEPADDVDNNIDTAERNRIVYRRPERTAERTNGRLDVVLCCVFTAAHFPSLSIPRDFSVGFAILLFFFALNRVRERRRLPELHYRTGRTLGTFRKRNVFIFIMIIIAPCVSYFQVDCRTAL